MKTILQIGVGRIIKPELSLPRAALLNAIAKGIKNWFYRAIGSYGITSTNCH